MTEADTQTVGRRYQSAILWAVSLYVCIAVPVEIIIYARTAFESAKAPANDFTAFYVVGELARSGQIAHAYVLSSLGAALYDATGKHQVLTWGYPPSYDLIAATLPLWPLAWSYGFFMLSTFAAFIWGLAGLGWQRSRWALVFSLPVLVIVPMMGQNGFLTGALAAWYAVEFRNNRATAGIPLGLLLIKPQLAIGLAALAVFQRRLDIMAWATATFLATSGAATVIFGPDVWMHFFHGLKQSSEVLRNGSYHLFRMPSIYSALMSLGLPFAASISVQACSATFAIATLYRVQRSQCNVDQILAFAMLVTLLISPYIYDYDMVIFGVAVALFSPDLATSLKPIQTFLLAIAVWIMLAPTYYRIFWPDTVGMTNLTLSHMMGFLPGFFAPILFAVTSRTVFRTHVS